MLHIINRAYIIFSLSLLKISMYLFLVINYLREYFRCISIEGEKDNEKNSML